MLKLQILIARLIRRLRLPREPSPPGLVLFSERIRERHRLWIETDTPDVHSLLECRTAVMKPEDPPESWKCCPYWQRKLSNKTNGKAFAIRHGARVATLLWQGKDPASIPFDSLPSRYVVKTSIGWSSKQVVAMCNGLDLITRKKQDPRKIVDRFRRHMSHPPFNEGVVLVEDLLLEGEASRLPDDYMFYVFGGRVELIEHLDRNRPSLNTYTRDWEPTDLLGPAYPAGPLIPRPRRLDELVEVAERLGRAYEVFVRVDLYATERGVFFGEFTPFSSKGKGFADRANIKYGCIWNRTESDGDRSLAMEV